MNSKFIFLTSLAAAVFVLIYNKAILESMNLIRFSYLTVFMKIITSIVFIALLFVLYSFLLKEKRNIILLWITAISAYIINFILKNIFRVPRPIGIIEETGYSFPSLHAAVIFSSLAVMNSRFEKYKYLFLIIAVLVAFSRLYLGVHYLSDILVGAIIGYLIGSYINKKWK